MTHQTTIDVRFNEIDPYGHVNHSVYVTYFEVARTKALVDCGIPLHVMAERGYQLVITRIDVRYRGAAELGDQLVVETEIGEARRASSTWDQRILRGDQVLVEAAVTAGVTDARGRPTKPPEWLFPSLEPLRPTVDDG